MTMPDVCECFSVPDETKALGIAAVAEIRKAIERHCESLETASVYPSWTTNMGTHV